MVNGWLPQGTQQHTVGLRRVPSPCPPHPPGGKGQSQPQGGLLCARSATRRTGCCGCCSPPHSGGGHTGCQRWQLLCAVAGFRSPRRWVLLARGPAHLQAQRSAAQQRQGRGSCQQRKGEGMGGEGGARIWRETAKHGNSQPSQLLLPFRLGSRTAPSTTQHKRTCFN